MGRTRLWAIQATLILGVACASDAEDPVSVSAADSGCAPELPDGATANAIDMTLRLKNGVNQSEIEGVSAKLCAISDLACEAPLADFGASDAMGDVFITVDATVDLVVSLTSEAILPTLVQLPQSGYLDAGGTTTEIPLIARSSTALLKTATGEDFDETKSIYVGDMKLCADASPSGLQVGLLSDSASPPKTFYFQNQLPNPLRQATDESGRWLIMNAPATGGTVSIVEGAPELSATIVGQPGTVTLLSLDQRIHAP